ncbi:DNA polymerase III subunit delta' [Pseudoroseicyclus aestuarii]|uniref:DNA polymerase-3 subunit delta n=1 Tax=Pseudoroseicyclus aestuarii TaxID=1795041 RepID=A0A318SYP3_9RHOB|nr:DNA polymerase III subunit delta' [Pseudoroseicyclus aestuarii]PYE80857.1 DNA polymerase-3 subunit delta' [Pseudoroseicyclus aestuarii]
MSEPLPDPTVLPGLPHPREARVLLGQQAPAQEFLAAHEGQRLHSGWLIAGPPGTGKATLAWRIAAYLLADPASRHPGTLEVETGDRDARLVRGGAHPRLFVLKRGANAKGDRLSDVIRVDEVRELKDFFHLSAADGGHRVVIIDSADELNPAAANAVLKELEEPPADTTLLLISHSPSRLLPTIRSRCRVLRCRPLAPDDLTAALSAAGVEAEEGDALAVLAAGSVGTAARLAQAGGLELYAALVALFERLPDLDRPALLKLADSAGARGAEARFDLMIDLIGLLLSRAARAGAMGPPAREGAPGEARLLARIAPDAAAARRWAGLEQELTARARSGRAVNLDPSALILDTLLKIEQAARGPAAA